MSLILPSARVLLASPLGVLVGLSLGTLGGGGSVLAVPALVYGANQTAQQATATSLVLVGVASLVGLRPHLKAGRVHVRTGVTFGLTGIAGSVVGSAVNRRLDPDVLLLWFAGLIIVAAWRMLTACPTCTVVGERRALDASTSISDENAGATARSRVLLLLAGTGVGFLTGLFGVGGGFVIVPALTLLLHLPMPQAIGTSLVVISINAAIALLSRLGSGSIDWATTIPFTIAAIIGVSLGGRLADRIDATRSLRWFATLLVGVAAWTGYGAIQTLVAN